MPIGPMSFQCAQAAHELCGGFEACGCHCHVPGREPEAEEITTAEAWRRYLAADSEAARAHARSVFQASLSRWSRIR